MSERLCAANDWCVAGVRREGDLCWRGHRQMIGRLRCLGCGRQITIRESMDWARRKLCRKCDPKGGRRFPRDASKSAGSPPHHCTCGAELDDDNETGYCSRECLEEDRQHDGFDDEPPQEREP